jgi:hypothetical protein
MNITSHQQMMMNGIVEIKPMFCEENMQDIQTILDLCDDVASAATTMTTQGGQACQQFIDARHRFREFLLTSAEHYRYVVLK